MCNKVVKAAKKISNKKILVKKLDAMFSNYIRLRDKRTNNGFCVFGCGNMIEVCFHLITRARYATRWDELNCFGSCNGCNYKNEWNPSPFILWFIKRFGRQAYEAMVLKSNKPARYSMEDLKSIRKNLGKKLEMVLLENKKSVQ